MRLPHALLAISACAALGAFAPGTARADDAPSTQPGVPEVEIERLEPQDEIETLRFLRENREFFRAQLDLLRQTFGSLHFGYAQGLDRRALMLQELLAQGRAGADSASLAAANDRTRRLLESVAELAALEDEMNRMEEMLGLQRERLALLEEDFAGRQETALIVLLAGVPSGGSPEEIRFREVGGDTYRVALSAPEREALAHGGLAQLFHAFVEPRELRFAVSLQKDGLASAPELHVVVTPERDRLTFLELDLAAAGVGSEGMIPTRVWVR
jgi:hypothetical protein